MLYFGKMGRMPKIDRQREHQAERTYFSGLVAYFHCSDRVWLCVRAAMRSIIARFGLFLRELESAVTGKNRVSNSFINSQNLGLSLIIVAILIIGLSVWRYNQVFRQIESSNYQPSRLMVWLYSARPQTELFLCL